MKRLFFRKVILWSLLGLALAASAAALWNPARDFRGASLDQDKRGPIPAAEFSRLVQSMSEQDGYFRSDNFTSNESSYLTVVDRLRELGVSGGAYIGVGPEQNFTYIAKIRPEIAFIVDIRRQAVLQHLLYKALFHISETRAGFLSALLSRPLEGGLAPGKGASLERLLQYFDSAAAPGQFFKTNLARVRKIIREEFKLPVSDYDQEKLAYVYSAFRDQGLEIGFRTGGSNWGRGFGRFPSLRDLTLQTDLHGKPGNFLAADDDYRFLRSLQLQNRIIPVVGDFAGQKALASVGDYLRRNGYTVRAFYTSNVEQYLFRNYTFGAFAENVKNLPIDTLSVFIRSVSSRGWAHPAYVAGHRNTTVLQKISLFLAGYDEGAYTDYWSLVTTHFVPARRP